MRQLPSSARGRDIGREPARAGPTAPVKISWRMSARRSEGMRQRNAVTAYQLRDRQGASRAVAYLMLAGAPFVFVTGVVLTPDRPLAGLVAVVVTSLVLAVGGWACWSRPQLLPDL